MSVLCRWPTTKGKNDISSIYAFDEFEKLIEHIDGKLRPGGILAVYNSNYFFEDTAAFANYDAVPGCDEIETGFVERFSKEGAPSTRRGNVIFRKKYKPLQRLSHAIKQRLA